MSKTWVILCFVAAIFFQFLATANGWSPFCTKTKFTVHVVDGLSSNAQPLLLHCWSRDQDLGNHTLYIGGDFFFHFRQRFFPPPTRFQCDMNWGPKHLQVTVFDKDRVKDDCCKTGTCFWRAQDDGIYYSNSNSSYFKVYAWE
ncbi:hypothetical protein Tsubulata_027131 [Turnera subulata]|uniref:S-protein homolog n=1 Tax=Turnera subulata TaxID=218843 RepID=A0A9Q0GI32_9ROSI|nr:hypothetical protein Tsubulata_027131 [Turnera subulata]